MDIPEEIPEESIITRKNVNDNDEASATEKRKRQTASTVTMTMNVSSSLHVAGSSGCSAPDTPSLAENIIRYQESRQTR